MVSGSATIFDATNVYQADPEAEQFPWSSTRGHTVTKPRHRPGLFVVRPMAAMGQKETKVADLCSELGITRQTLYRHVAPDGTLRKDGLKVVEAGRTRNLHGQKP
jgi:hypothetical protein